MPDEQTQDQSEKDYEAAWDESQGTDDKPDKDDKPAEFDDEGNETPNDEQEGDAPDKPDDDPDAGATDDEPDGKKPEGEKPPADEPATAEKVKQELKEWQGRARKAREEAEREEARLKQLSQQQTQRKETEQPTVPDELELSDEDKKAIEEMESEYGGLMPGVTALAKRMAGEIVKSHVPGLIKQSVDPIQQSAREAASRGHWSAIKSAHNDFDDLKSELRPWAESLPYADAVKYLHAIQKGNSQEVIEMIDAYKSSRSTDQPPADPPDNSQSNKRQQQLDANSGARSRGGGRPAAKADKDDYDGAWEEATR